MMILVMIQLLLELKDLLEKPTGCIDMTVILYMIIILYMINILIINSFI